jgi:hypothetical protein
MNRPFACPRATLTGFLTQFDFASDRPFNCGSWRRSRGRKIVWYVWDTMLVGIDTHRVGRRRGSTPGAEDVSLSQVEALDRELAGVSRSAGALRLAVGMGLEALARDDGFHALGFSSLAAYALERCERRKRWMQESRWLARRLSELPRIRAALTSGGIKWSMAAELARVAHDSDEEMWLERASTATVRAMREHVRQLLGAPSVGEHLDDDGPQPMTEDTCTLTVTADREDAWLLEAVRMVVRREGSTTSEELVEALLGEGETSLFPYVPKDAIVCGDDDAESDAQRAYVAQREACRREAELRCEPRIPRDAMEPAPTQPDPDFTGAPERVDQEICRISAQMTSRDLTVGQLANRLWRADGWRRLGYATPAQYARERLGMSHTSVKDKRTLTRRIERLPHLGRALQRAAVGYEAARLVTLVATPHTDPRWTERATTRTVCHLREEVDAALVLSRLQHDAAIEPPTEEQLRDLHVLEARIVSGATVVANAANETMLPGRTSASASAGSKGQLSARSACAMVAPALAITSGTARCSLDEQNGVQAANLAAPCTMSHLSASTVAEHTVAVLTQYFEHRRRTPRPLRSRGRITLRFQVSRGLCRAYRRRERLYLRFRPLPASFLYFACSALLDSWAYALPPVAYGHIYERDGFRCSNPLCSRRDVTPHHTVFRSHLGTDDDDNVISLCVWCHLDGVHGGRITVHGPANDLTWRLGRTPHTIVQGRTRTRVSS